MFITNNKLNFLVMDKNIKIDLSWMKDIKGGIEYESPAIFDLTDKKTKLLSEINSGVKDVKENTKKQIWRDILLIIIGSIITCIITLILG